MAKRGNSQAGSGRVQKARPKRSDPDYTQRSYLLPKALARDVDVLAAVMGRQHSELAEDALRAYVKKHSRKLP